MTDQPGWGQPDAWGPSEPQPPHPGWSPVQPGSHPPPGAYPPPTPPPSQPYQQMPPPPGYPGFPGYSYVQPTAPKPGVIPLRPLSVGEILDGAIQCVRANPKIMLGLSAVVVTVTQLISFAITAAFAQDLNAIDPETATPDEMFRAFGNLFGASVIAGLVSALAQVILAGILTVVVGRAVLGQSITLAEAWSQLRPRIWPLIGVSLLVVLLASLPVVGGVGLLAALTAIAGPLGAVIGVLVLLASVAASVWLYVKWWLATPGVVLERAKVTQAMRRSWTLVGRAWWRTFFIIVLTLVLTFVISAIVSVPFQLLSGFSTFSTDPQQVQMISTSSLLASTLGSIIGGTLTYPFTAAVTVLVYVDRRMRLEGLDLELARAAGVPPRQ